MTTLAITGATGALGRLVVADLLESGTAPDEVVAVVRNPAKAANLAEQGVTVREADYADPAALRTALEGVERLLLISGDAVGARVEQHTNVIEAARDAGVAHIVYTSILNADASSNPLVDEHIATEKVLAASGVAHTVLRNAWYSENYTTQLPQYLATGEILSATDDAPISAAARADFAAAAVGALRSAGAESRTFELGGPAFTLTELAEAITEATGTTVVHRVVSADELVATMTSDGQDATWPNIQARVDRSIAAGEMHTDSNALEELMGHAPTTITEVVRAAV